MIDETFKKIIHSVIYKNEHEIDVSKNFLFIYLYEYNFNETSMFTMNNFHTILMDINYFNCLDICGIYYFVFTDILYLKYYKLNERILKL